MGRRWVWVLLALTLTAGTAACSASRGNPAVPASSPTSAAPSAAASTVADRTAARSSGTALPLPNYQPSKVVTETSGGVQLSSADPVSKVASFYENALKSRGWRIISADKNAVSTTMVAMRGTTGLGISISRGDPAGTAIIVTRCQC
jgi:hypothetical protein